jgi:hypothetical protein
MLGMGGVGVRVWGLGVWVEAGEDAVGVLVKSLGDVLGRSHGFRELMYVEFLVIVSGGRVTVYSILGGLMVRGPSESMLQSIQMLLTDPVEL